MRKHFLIIIFHLVLLFGWAIAIAWLSLANPPAVDYGVLGWDKLHHAAAYGGLMLLALISLRDRCTLNVINCALSWFAVVAYGGLLEIAQLTLTSTRTAEWWDLFADGVGVSVVLLLVIYAEKRSWIR